MHKRTATMNHQTVQDLTPENYHYQGSAQKQSGSCAPVVVANIPASKLVPNTASYRNIIPIHNTLYL